MKNRILLAITLIAISGCVARAKYREDVFTAYRKGFRVGRVVGRDDVLDELKSPDCFVQDVDELMGPDKGEEK